MKHQTKLCGCLILATMISMSIFEYYTQGTSRWIHNARNQEKSQQSQHTHMLSTMTQLHVDLLSNNSLGDDSASKSSTHQLLLLPPRSFIPLTSKEVDLIEKFVFFIGYPRSGHSIFGTMMDSHPNMIIAHEYRLFDTLRDNSSLAKHHLFNSLYQNSFEELVNGSRGLKGLQRKGYLLAINKLWQANFTQLKVIGNKHGGYVAKRFAQNPGAIKAAYHRLVALVGIPVLVIHIVRNPLDIIASHTLYCAGKNGHKFNANETMRYNNTNMVTAATNSIFKRADAVVELVNSLNLLVLEIHHEDMVKDPRSNLLRLCTFLEVDCPEKFLQSCEEKSFASSVKSRNTIVWNEHLLGRIRNRMLRYPFFKRYYNDIH